MLLKDITFVIPSLNKIVETVDSIPCGCKYIIRDDESTGKARNEGMRRVETEWIVLADDDIKFNYIFFDFIKQLSDKNSIIGLQGYAPSPWLISRFMLFHRSVYDTIGGMKERNHGEETEWLIRAQKAGFKLIALPRESVYHYPHTKANKNEFKNLLWLLWLHPDLIIKPFKVVINKMIKSSDDSEYK